MDEFTKKRMEKMHDELVEEGNRSAGRLTGIFSQSTIDRVQQEVKNMSQNLFDLDESEMTDTRIAEEAVKIAERLSAITGKPVDPKQIIRIAEEALSAMMKEEEGRKK
jgi:hypothetical protein